MRLVPGLIGIFVIVLGLTIAAMARLLDFQLSRMLMRRWDRWLKDAEGYDESLARESGRASSAHASISVTAVPRSTDLVDDPRLNVSTWAVSKERDAFLDRRRRSYIYAVAAAFVAFGSAVLFAGQDAPMLDYVALWRTVAVGAMIVAVLILALAFVPYLSARSAYRQRRLATASAKVDLAISVASNGRDGKVLKLGQLFDLNRRQLDEYQLITRKQQRSAFILAQIATVVAFSVLLGGVFIALSATSTVDKYLTSGMTALGTLLSGFLAATFFSAVKDANAQMNRYYLEPQRTGRLLAAERIVEQMSDEGTNRTEMVKAVLNWEMPSAGDQVSAGPRADGASDAEK